MKPLIMKGDQYGTGAVDFSYLLDAPAGKHGFVTVRDGHFYLENGKRIRFFGVDLAIGGAVPEKDTADMIAERLARSGVNIARLHMVDIYQQGTDTNSIIDYANDNSQKLNTVSMNRLDYLISVLKKRGIYIHIDLFVNRAFLPGDDLDYPDSLVAPAPLKNVQFFNRRLIELQKKFANQYLTHLNPYTGLRYVDEPAVATVQLTNENSILWDSGTWEKPSYIKELDRRWNEWLLSKYGSREALDEAWTKEDGTRALSVEEDPGKGNVKRPPIGLWTERTLDYRKNYADIEGPARFADHVEFLMKLEIYYIEEMMEYLKSIGVKVPINASNHPKGAAELRALAEGDVMENNAYWNHPSRGHRPPAPFHKKEMYCTDPREVRVPPFELNLVTRLATAAVREKPMVVTEWNACYPTKFRGEAMLMLASYACLQDWDGLILHAYTHARVKKLLFTEKMTSFWESYNDPAIWGLAGVASSIFQEGRVSTAGNYAELVYTEEDLKSLHENWMAPYGVLPYISRMAVCFAGQQGYDGVADMALNAGFTASGDYTRSKHALVYSRSPYGDNYQKKASREIFLNKHREEENAAVLNGSDERAVGTIGEKFAVIDCEEYIDKDYKEFSHIIDNSMKKWGLLNENYGLQNNGTLVSDTGEIIYNFSEGEFKVVTDRLVVFAGNIKGKVEVGEYTLELKNTKASISIIPREGRDLKQSRNILITAVGESENTNMIWEGNTLIHEGEAPVLIDQIEGSIFLPTEEENCRAYALDAGGNRSEEIEVKRLGDGFKVCLNNKEGAIYYEVILGG